MAIYNHGYSLCLEALLSLVELVQSQVKTGLVQGHLGHYVYYSTKIMIVIMYRIHHYVEIIIEIMMIIKGN